MLKFRKLAFFNSIYDDQKNGPYEPQSEAFLKLTWKQYISIKAKNRNDTIYPPIPDDFLDNPLLLFKN